MPAKRKRPAMQRIARRVITDTEGGSSPGTPSGVPAAEDFDFALPLESRPVTDALIAVLASNYGADDPVRRTRLKLLFEGPLAGRIERFPYSLASLSRANDATEKVYTALAYDLPCLIAPPYIMGPSWTVQGTGIFNRDQRIPFATEASSFDACACLRAWIAKHDSSLNVKEILDTAIEYHSVAVLEWILLCARPSGPPYSSGLPDHWKDELGELLGTANGRREMILLVMAGEARLIERTGGIVPKEAVARLERVFSLLKVGIYCVWFALDTNTCFSRPHFSPLNRTTRRFMTSSFLQPGRLSSPARSKRATSSYAS